MDDFKNKVVWITGASSGIGEAIAYTFAKECAGLILSGRNMGELERVKGNCVGAGFVKIARLDIGDFQSCFDLAKEVIADVGRIDILINNAGISQRSKAVETDFEVDRQLIEVNLLGTIALTKAVLPQMIAQKSGEIVVISSLMGKFGAPVRSSYAAAKHGLHGFFDSLRAEIYLEGIKVLIVCPGFVRTNISINALNASGKKQGTMDDATGNGVSPQYVAEKILWALRSGKEEIYVGKKEVVGIYLKRFFPRIFSRIVRKAKVV
jgi:dehydrogenase/reductase SDR family member 7B